MNQFKIYLLKNKYWKLIIIILISLLSILVYFNTVPSNGENFSPQLRSEKNDPPEVIIQTTFGETLVFQQPSFPDLVCLVTDYGAQPDNKTLNTAAFTKAIDDCSSRGGGKVVIPAGTWLTGPIHLKNNIDLHIEKEATILFSTNFDDYLPVVFSRFEGIEYFNYSPPIYAKDCTNVALTGEGKLDGQAQAWWKMQSTDAANNLYAMGNQNTPLAERVFGTAPLGLRPSFVEFINCSNIIIKDLHFFNGPMWTIHPIYSDHIIIRNIKIETESGPNTDGIVIDSSKNVLIENSILNTGDDAIALKSGRDKDGMRINRPTENIIVRNCEIRNAHSAFAIGSEVSGDVRNVFVTDLTVDRAQFGIRFKSTLGRGGTIENIWVQNISMRRATIDAIEIDNFYGTPFDDTSKNVSTFRNLHFENISAKRASHAITISGFTDKPIHDISLENIHLETKRGIDISNTSNIKLINVKANPQNKDYLIKISDGNNITISKADCLPDTSTCLSVNGTRSSNINITDSGFAGYTDKITQGTETKKDAIVFIDNGP